MKMIKGVIMPGPCLACGATGKYDPELFNDPDDFIDCEFCQGTGYSQRNHTVIERDTGNTKFGKVIDILGKIYDEYLWCLRNAGEEDLPDDVDTIMDLVEEEAQAGILTAVLFRTGRIDKTQYAKTVIMDAWDRTLEAYDWSYDMNFKKFKDVRAGGSGWQIFDETDFDD